MKLTNSGFQRGYNPIVVEGDASDMNMDFGELLMEKGDTVSYNEPKECIYVLVTGKVTSISSCPKMATAMPRWETPFIKFTTTTPPAWPTA